MSSPKVALVTGGSRGIGRACVVALAKAGYNVAFSYARNADAANEVVALCQKRFGSTVTVKAYASDAADTAQAAALVETVTADWGRLDAVINNAGITRDTLLMRMSDEQWQDVIQTNLTGVFATCRSAVKVMMKQRSGHIVTIASVVGVYGNAGQTNYAAAKAGLIGLTKSIAKEVGSRGITANVIAPGFIETDMTHDLPHKEQLLGHIPLKRFGQADDIAKAVVFLVTSAPYITGQVLHVDGGLVF
jgi:3-oxoacyl-[acyl-carrier protein] reductase